MFSHQYVSVDDDTVFCKERCNIVLKGAVGINYSAVGIALMSCHYAPLQISKQCVLMT